MYREAGRSRHPHRPREAMRGALVCAALACSAALFTACGPAHDDGGAADARARDDVRSDADAGTESTEPPRDAGDASGDTDVDDGGADEGVDGGVDGSADDGVDDGVDGGVDDDEPTPADDAGTAEPAPDAGEEPDPPPSGPVCEAGVTAGARCADHGVSGGTADVLYWCEGAGSATVIEACALGCVPSDVGADACASAPVLPPAPLVVLTANVENLPRAADQCPGDHRDLYYWLAQAERAPDVFLVQQLSGAAQLAELLALLTEMLGRPYEGVIAEDNPTPFDSPCGPKKDQQTNALIYATDRLSAIGAPQVFHALRTDGATGCVQAGSSRTRAVALALWDSHGARTIAAASIHWSTQNGTGADPACAGANAARTDEVLHALAPDAALYVFGGDANEPDTVTHDAASAFHNWYASTNAALGGAGDGAPAYTDPIYARCEAQSSTNAEVRDCLLGHWTFSFTNTNRRIDFLFARTPDGAPTVGYAHTVTFNEASAADQAVTGSDNPLGYSDHRAVLSELSY